MIKTIAKEAGIVILLLVAVALILGIIFYEYIPNNKTVPAKIEAYTLPEEIKAELQEGMTEEQNIVRTYYIDSTDLSAYESTNEYDKGKANPFADYTANTSDGNNTSNNNSNNNNSNNNSNNSNVNNNTNENNMKNTNGSEVFFNTSGK